MNNQVGGGGSPSSRFATIFVVITLVVLDQVTKWMIQSAFSLGESKTIIPGFFDLVLIQNKGAAFGFLANVDSAWVCRGFTIIAILAIVAIFFIYKSLETGDRLSRIALVLIGAGALGNLIDRVRFCSVTDFLLFYMDEYQWPAFNVADSCVTVGVALLALGMFYSPGKSDKA